MRTKTTSWRSHSPLSVHPLLCSVYLSLYIYTAITLMAIMAVISSD
ncbi:MULTISPECIES: hypothetical protein [Trichocoleus]|uniref:Uncharacterized protein n=1 Tax=Trichocoleus desertorum GB2-A4 TaxID=2933944 RepID=A0ABV0J1H2_9CYAN|nr:hypothetical protein [Trichocoleus sp. FACHB-46]MBD1860238.1 hypothetical protein [Trichocoleus sp. FACHB-46]